MRTRAIAPAVIILLVSLLVLPVGLAAKERRGATVVITRTDGRLVEGELIAVKPEGLVVLSPVSADSISINPAEIASVRIVRPSKAGKGALLGGLGGALIGGLLGGLSGGIDEYTAGQAGVMLGVFFGGVGCLGGLGLGALLSVDTTIPFAGEPEALVRSRLGNLLPFSREYRLGGGRMKLEIRPASAPAPRPPVPVPEVAGAAAPPARRSLRFRVRLPYTLAIRPNPHYDDSDRYSSAFSFPGHTQEPGPFPAEVIRHPGNQNGAGFDSVSLGYELSDRLAVEAEAVFGHWGAGGTDASLLEFTSALDGISYQTGWYFDRTARFSAALIGLTYRQAAPTEFRRHIIEAGLAVGPAWARLRADEWSLGQADVPSGKVTLAARAHAAYDFFVTSTVAFGIAVGYRHFRVALPASTSTAVLTFHEKVGPGEFPSIFFDRTTQLLIAARTIDASGFYIGLRTSLRF